MDLNTIDDLNENIIKFMELYTNENIDKGFSKDKIWFDEDFKEMDDLQKILKNRNYQVTDEEIFDKQGKRKPVR